MIFHCVVTKHKVPQRVEKNFKYSALLSDHSRIWESQRLKFAHPISTTLPDPFHHLTSIILLFNSLFLCRLMQNLRLRLFNSTFYLRNLLLNLRYLALSICYFLLHHFVDGLVIVLRTLDLQRIMKMKPSFFRVEIAPLISCFILFQPFWPAMLSAGRETAHYSRWLSWFIREGPKTTFSLSRSSCSRCNVIETEERLFFPSISPDTFY